MPVVLQSLPGWWQGVLAFVLGAVVIAAAGPASANSRHAALVVDANNGAVLHSDQADEIRYPASLTKLMTLYLAFEAIERGRLSYQTRIKVSHEAASAPPTKLDLDPGETIALIDAIKGLVVRSANDAAIVIAEHLGGTEANFARMMTAKARLFGMSRTTFRNASGLPDPGQVTTARDMVRLALRLHDDFPQHYALFALRSFSYDGSNYRSHNNLLFRLQGTDGIKTGYTRASGFNLVSSVRRGGRHVVGAVFGGSTAARRDDAMQLLLARALIRSSPYKTRQSAPVLVASAEPARRPEPTQTRAPLPARPPITPPAFTPPAVEATTPQSRPVMVPQRAKSLVVADARERWMRQSFVDAPTQVPVPAPVPAVRPQTATAAPPRPVVETNNQRLAFVPGGVQSGQAARGGPAAPAVTSPASRGAPPSTFQQQAINLSRGGSAGITEPPASAPRALPTPYAVRGPGSGNAPAHGNAVPVSGAGFEIQIGAYATAAEADRALSVARGQAGELLRASEGRAILARKDSRQIYRARFVGFDSQRAASTCLELRRRQIDCFVMRTE